MFAGSIRGHYPIVTRVCTTKVVCRRPRRKRNKGRFEGIRRTALNTIAARSARTCVDALNAVVVFLMWCLGLLIGRIRINAYCQVLISLLERDVLISLVESLACCPVCERRVVFVRC